MQIPGPGHPIDIQPVAQAVTVLVDEVVVMRSLHALVMLEADYRPVYYFPVDDVPFGALERSSTLSFCPYKGDCSYFHLCVGGRRIIDAGWEYQHPYLPVAKIAGHIAFYDSKVRLAIQADPEPRSG